MPLRGPINALLRCSHARLTALICCTCLGHACRSATSMQGLGLDASIMDDVSAHLCFCR